MATDPYRRWEAAYVAASPLPESEKHRPPAAAAL